MIEHLPKIGRQEPTLKNADESLPSVMDDPVFDNALKSWGVNLMVFQSSLLRYSLMFRTESNETMTYAYKQYGVSVPRQNGKTEVIVARILIGLVFTNDNMFYTSHQQASAVAIFHRVLDIIEYGPESLKRFFPDLPGRKVKRPCITARDPETGRPIGSVEFFTRGGGSTGRGRSTNLIFFDEAQELARGEEDALVPVVSSFKNNQIWYVGTPEPREVAGTKGAHSMKSSGLSTRFAEIRSKLSTGKGVFWAEWGVIELTDPMNRSQWYEANPALGITFAKGRGLTEETIAGEAQSMSPETFNIERLGYWSTQDRNHAIDITLWNSLALSKNSSDVKTMGFLKGSRAVCVKTNPEHTNCYVAVGAQGSDGIALVEVIASLPTDGNWLDRLWSVIEPLYNSPVVKQIVFDGDLGMSRGKEMLSSRGKWDMRNVSAYKYGKVSMARPADMAEASSSFMGKVADRTIRHFGDPKTASIISDAQQRFSGRGGLLRQIGFDSISGKTDSTVIECMALAVSFASRYKSVQTGNHTDDGIKVSESVGGDIEVSNSDIVISDYRSI